jgi:hypothetical protein
VMMSGAFDMPFDVLAFDESRVGTASSGRVESSTEQHDGVSPSVISVVRGKNRAPR